MPSLLAIEEERATAAKNEDVRLLLAAIAAALIMVSGACSYGDSGDSASADEAHCEVFTEAEAERVLGAASVNQVDFIDLVEKALPDDAARAQAEAAGENICAYGTGEGEPPTSPVAAYQFGPGGFDSPEAFYDAHDTGEQVDDLGDAAVYEDGAGIVNDDGSKPGGAITVLIDGGQTFTVAVYNVSVDRDTLIEVADVIMGRL